MIIGNLFEAVSNLGPDETLTFSHNPDSGVTLTIANRESRVVMKLDEDILQSTPDAFCLLGFQIAAAMNRLRTLSDAVKEAQE